jgi:hypothetical protein
LEIRPVETVDAVLDVALLPAAAATAATAPRAARGDRAAARPASTGAR